MDGWVVPILLDVALAVVIAPAVMWLLQDLLDAFGGSASPRPGDTPRVHTRSVLAPR
jgi:hypothetical protein